jgi:hypothetical protein
MDADIAYALFIGISAFNFCLSMATLLFVFKLWLDVYHNRWFKKLNEINYKKQ